MCIHIIIPKSLPCVPSTYETHPAANFGRSASNSAESGCTARNSLLVSLCGRNSASCCCICAVFRHGVPEREREREREREFVCVCVCVQSMHTCVHTYCTSVSPLLSVPCYLLGRYRKAKTPSVRQRRACRSRLDL